jgi:invasion protein IalB
MKQAIFLVAALAAPAALAQAPETPAPPAAAPQRSDPAGGRGAMLDPNQTVCRSQSVIGSRLTRARVCVTRQQWNEQRQQDRLLAEQAQTRRNWCGGGACPP